MALDIIRRELDTTLALCGLRDVKDVDERILALGRVARRPEFGRSAMAFSGARESVG